MNKNYFQFSESDKLIYDNELSGFIPNNIIDLHVHLWRSVDLAYIPENINNPFLDYKCFPEFNFKEFKMIVSTLFKGKSYQGAFFGNPFKNINIEENNKYILNLSKETDSFCYYIPTPSDNLEGKVFKEFTSYKKFLGFKPYPDLSSKNTGLELGIYDFLNEYVLEYANDNRLIIMLHLPRKKRLADVNNIKEIKEITNKYKKIKFILAHAGRSYCLSTIANVINDIKDIDNLFFDISFINDWEIFEILLNKIDIGKIFFASDMPASILKGKNICINNSHYFVTKEDFEWSLHSNKNLSGDYTFFIYEQIRELKKAMFKLNKLNDESVEDIFFNNAKRVISA